MTHQEKCRYWQTQLAVQVQSGLSKAAFCRREQLSLSSFHYWTSKLSAQTAMPEHRLIPVRVCDESPRAEPMLTLTSPGGWQLSFPASTPAETLLLLMPVLTA